jgi:E3 ubiquitin-protein ligase HERC4
VPYRVFALAGERIASMAVGDGFTVAVTEAGAVYSFGWGDGRLGHGHCCEDVLLLKLIEALDGIHVTTVAAGDYHTLALTRCGRVYTWGEEGRDSPVHGLGEEIDGLGEDDFFKPQLITALLGERVRAIAAVPMTSCAVTDTGALYTYGENKYGNLALGDPRDRDKSTLVQMLHGIRVVGVSMYATHTLALSADGSVYAFGQGPGLGIRPELGGEAVDARMLTPQRIPNLNCMVRQ